MGLAIKVTMEDGAELSTAYLVRIGGWTEDQYFREASETRIIEFEDGEVIVHSPAKPKHQEVTLFLSILAQAYVRRRNLGKILNGPAVVRLRPGLNYEPDIFFIPLARFEGIGEEFFFGAPAFAVEVLSEGTRAHDLVTKAAAYRLHGVPEYWAVDADRRRLIRHLLPEDLAAPYRIGQHSDGRIESAAIAGFWIDVSWLWQDPLPDPLHCLEQILAS